MGESKDRKGLKQRLLQAKRIADLALESASRGWCRRWKSSSGCQVRQTKTAQRDCSPLFTPSMSNSWGPRTKEDFEDG